MINNDKIFSSESYNFDNEQSQEGIGTVIKTVGILYLALLVMAAIGTVINTQKEKAVKNFMKNNKSKLSRIKSFIDSCIKEYDELVKYIENYCSTTFGMNGSTYNDELKIEDIVEPIKNNLSKRKRYDKKQLIDLLNKRSKKVYIHASFYYHNDVDYNSKEYAQIETNISKFCKDIKSKQLKYLKILSSEKEIIDSIDEGFGTIEIIVDYTNLNVEALYDFNED